MVQLFREVLIFGDCLRMLPTLFSINLLRHPDSSCRYADDLLQIRWNQVARLRNLPLNRWWLVIAKATNVATLTSSSHPVRKPSTTQ